VGETGLDFHYDNSPRDVQRRLFRHHLEMADRLSLPVVVHSRSADQDTETILRELGGGVTGVLHCYTGGRSLMDAALELGWYVSFTGIASFAGFRGEDEVRGVPRARLMVETDAPYLAPVPRRGERNEPAFVRHVAEALARIRGEEPEDLATVTTGNARRFYGLS
jgi:TatD DNase family protein